MHLNDDIPVCFKAGNDKNENNGNLIVIWPTEGQIIPGEKSCL
jgi:hypothetical protein